MLNCFIHTWEIVQSCALPDRSGNLLFFKVIIKLGVDGLRGIRSASIRMRTIGTEGGEIWVIKLNSIARKSSNYTNNIMFSLVKMRCVKLITGINRCATILQITDLCGSLLRVRTTQLHPTGPISGQNVLFPLTSQL